MQNYEFLKILKSWYLKSIYWDESDKIPPEYIFSYRSMRNRSQSLTLKFVNSIWEERSKTKGVTNTK